MNKKFSRFVLGIFGLAAALGASAQNWGNDTRLPEFPSVPPLIATRPRLKKAQKKAPVQTASTDEIGAEHLVMGNPSDATADAVHADNYLMRKPEYVLSYNNGTHNPNWVSWHLNASWIGNADRANDFHHDSQLPAGWIQITPEDYNETGFDSGHMCPSKDRTNAETANQATFAMTNMVPQAPQNNRRTWLGLEDYCRQLAAAGDELYIVAGPWGKGGEGLKGKMATLDIKRDGNSQGAIDVPQYTWKVALVLPRGQTSPADVTADATAIAVIIPNNQGIDPDWHKYIVPVSQVEAMTGYRFFSAVNADAAAAIKDKVYKDPTAP